MSQVIASSRSIETRPPVSLGGIGHFTLEAIKRRALQGKPSIRLKCDTRVMVCGCFQCTYAGDIDTPQAVKLARKDDGQAVLLHSGCGLEPGMEQLRLPLGKLVQVLQTVPGISGVSAINKSR